MKFGEDYKAPPKAADPAAAAAAAAPNEVSDDDTISVTSTEYRAKVQKFCYYFIPIFSGLLALLILILVPATSGTGGAAGNPKVLLFVMEGMKGTAFDNLMNEQNLLPNIKNLVLKGQYARCLSPQDSGCAQSQSGPALGPPFSFQSGPGLASILSGVDAVKHKVYNDSYNAYQQYFSTSKTYPSFLTTALNAGLRTSVIGETHLVTSISSSGTCTDFGILDFECSFDVATMCLATSSCNANDRRMVIPSNDFIGTEENSITNILVPLLTDLGSDIVVVHTGKLARLAANAAYPDWYFSEGSLPYAAEAYLLDTIVGQAASLIGVRAFGLKENWLIMGVSDHGGLGKTFGYNTPDDQLVTLFSSAVTSYGSIKMSPFTSPTTQFDVAPTILRWLGVPFAANQFDGVVQGICSDGKYPQNCTTY